MGDEDDLGRAARRLFAEGLAEADAGRWMEAADRFSRANGLRPTPEIAYNLSTALLHIGRLVSASDLLAAVAESPGARPEVRAAAEARLTQVRPRLAHLTVDAGSIGRGRVRIDGGPLDPTAVGRPLPVDPGTHVVELRPAAGGPLSRTLSLAEGAEETVSFGPPPSPSGAEGSPAAGLRARGGADRGAGEPLWRKGWFWGAIGAVAVTAVAVALAARGGQPAVRGNVDTWVIAP
jgi:hypothetical protein